MVRQKLSRERISAAALRLVDEQGLPALSMRKLGQALGVEAMSLYGHLPNKAAIVDALHERVLGEMDPPAMSGDWRVDVAALALAFRRALRAHPRVLPVFATRAAVAPGSLQQTDRALGVLMRAGFSAQLALAALHVVFTYVVGHGMYQFTPPEDQTAFDYAALPPERFPYLLAAARTLPQRNPDDEFMIGLNALIDGFAIQLAAGPPGAADLSRS